MTPCAVKRGIITLRDCGVESHDSCEICARAICQEHTIYRSGQARCVECDAREQETSVKENGDAKRQPRHAPPRRSTAETTEDGDESWPYRFRHHFYMSHGYRPFYGGHYYDSYYDSYDLRSFHRSSRNSGFHDDADEATGGFYDS